MEHGVTQVLRPVLRFGGAVPLLAGAGNDRTLLTGVVSS